MVAGDIGADSCGTPAVFGLVDPTKSSLVLEYEMNLFLWILYTKPLYCVLNFFEASIASVLAFLGCLDRGITLRHPCLFKSMYI